MTSYILMTSNDQCRTTVQLLNNDQLLITTYQWPAISDQLLMSSQTPVINVQLPVITVQLLINDQLLITSY